MAKQSILVLFFFVFVKYSIAASITYNVVRLGARADGRSDTSKAFLTAWARACVSVNPVTIYVPRGRFLLKDIVFSGQTCRNRRITFRIDGTLIAATGYSSGRSTNWIKFIRVNGVSVIGGTLDGRGSNLWACKNSRRCSSSTGATVTLLYDF